jgi:hypothetical protein
MEYFCTELMWLYIGEVFKAEIYLNVPPVNQNSTAIE